MIGGEELHNNHHTYPTSAKFSAKKYELDIGWIYIQMMQKIGWAKVKKVPPKLLMGDIQPMADEKTLQAIIANRYEVMARYAREVRSATKGELVQLKAQRADCSVLKAARRWLHRDDDKVPAAVRSSLVQARAAHPVLDKMMTMREELRQLWLNTSHSREQLVADLAAWCHRAETSFENSPPACAQHAWQSRWIRAAMEKTWAVMLRIVSTSSRIAGDQHCATHGSHAMRTSCRPTHASAFGHPGVGDLVDGCFGARG